MPLDLEALSVLGLLRLHVDALQELRRRRIVRSANNPIADYAEYLVATALGLELSERSNRGYDAISLDDVRYEVKARRWTRSSRPPHFSDIRDLDRGRFDFFVGVVLHTDFRVERACLVPAGVVRDLARYVPHTNGWRVRISDSLWSATGVEDITSDLARTEASLLS